MTPSKENPALTKTMAFVNHYMVFAEPGHDLVTALWCMMTTMWDHFDVMPYLHITASTKRAGKTRLLELVSFLARNTRSLVGATPATIFHYLKEERATLLMDEIERLSSEAASTMREVLNAGYRRGAVVPRMKKDVVEEYPVYGPKAFAGIGDVYDTLRDRTIAIVLTRATGEVTRMVYNEARADGNKLRDAMIEATTERQQDVLDKYVTMRLPFLTDRDEEIWLPLFALCSVFAPSRVEDLRRIAVDMATVKTSAAAHHRDLAAMESAAQDDEYALRLLSDLHTVMKGKHMWSEAAVSALREIDTAPWRKFRGEGITQNNLADILNRFGVVSVLIKMQKRVARGYRIENVKEAYAKQFGKK